MRRERLRERPDVDYQVVRSNDRWADHRERLLVTAGMIAWLRPETILDPACGDGSVLAAAYALAPFRLATLSDISVPGIASLHLAFPYQASVRPIEEALVGSSPVELVVLTEILEHLDDPDAVLRLARERARHLVASSPLDERTQNNPEHLWAWDTEGYSAMLEAAGWRITSSVILDWPGGYYRFQIVTAA